MVKLTMIARITDGLPLAEGLDDGRDLKDADFYKQQAKLLFKNLSKGQHESSRLSIETGPYYFHYIIESRVCYLTMCDRSYPKKLAFQYLEDLKNEFERVNGSQIETAARPYAFIKFGMVLRSYMDIFHIQLLISYWVIAYLSLFRYIHTENQETVFGYQNPKEPCQV
uniref:Longin domain-containing protein n=1 Tax=Triticum urartu TaxID=4572 RepID=A0A8R7TTE8_TRIUA